MFTKLIIVVDHDTDIRNYGELTWRAANSVDYARDIEIVKGPVDDLDHASGIPALGAYMTRLRLRHVTLIMLLASLAACTRPSYLAKWARPRRIRKRARTRSRSVNPSDMLRRAGPGPLARPWDCARSR